MSRKSRSNRDQLDSSDSSDSSDSNHNPLRSSDSSDTSSLSSLVSSDSNRLISSDSSDSNQNLALESDSSSMDASPPPKKSKTVSNQLDIDYTSNTQIKLDKFCYKWTINNYSFGYFKTRQYLSSPKFLTKADGKCHWELKLYPNGSEYDFSDYTSLYLRLSKDSIIKTSVYVKYKFCILNSKGERTNEIKKESRFNKSDSIGCHKFIKSNNLKDNNLLLPDDSLTILCEMYVTSDDNSCLNQNEIVEISSLSCALSNDIRLFFENIEFSDIILSAARTKFYAHKVILAARSKVFSAMFQHNLRVKKGNVVNLTDVKPKVLKEMLRYIYTDEVEDLQTLATEILNAAIKYDLEGLKYKCEKVIADSLHNENVIEVFLLAVRHNLDYLKHRSMLYIVTHAKDAIDSKEFKTLEKTNPRITVKILRAILLLK